MKKLLRLITNRMFLTGVLIVLEFGLFIGIIHFLSVDFKVAYITLEFLSIILVLYVVNRGVNPVYSLPWVLLILVVPPIGTVMFLMFGDRKVPKKLRQKLTDTYDESAFGEINDALIVQTLSSEHNRWERLLSYISNTSDYHLYQETRTEYLPSGEIKFERMKEELRKAKSFIFMEYFIIKDGVMWQETYEILKQKVQEGVNVRFIYDDWGAALFPELQKQCDDAGIQAIPFNRMEPRLAVQMNNRSHRKILIVDGRVGIVGGMNLADEYINIGSRFGHWKDTAVLIEGKAVYSLTLMFLQFWRYYSNVEEDPRQYAYDFKGEHKDQKGIIMPFSDAPTDHVDMGLDVHLQLINNAKRYVYIQTPYLIIGYELISALKMAALSGVDVRIIVPGIPDKKLVNEVTKSNYIELIKNGVKIYEYEPGFVHSKTVVVDDEIAVVGTTNMDYRSYYLHYECSIVFLDDDEVVSACYQDSISTIENKCRQITLAEAEDVSFVRQLIRSFVRIFSGMM